MNAQLSQLHSPTTYPGKTLPLTLLSDENVLLAWETQSRAEELIVTTHRIRLSRRAIGWRWTTSMLLESLTSCTLEFRSRVVFIVLAAVSLMGGLLGATAAQWPWSILFAIGGIGLGLLFGLLYVRSRDQVIEFTAPGATIKVRSSGRSLDDVRELVETVEAAKNARYIQRFARTSIAVTAPQPVAASSGQA